MHHRGVALGDRRRVVEYEDARGELLGYGRRVVHVPGDIAVFYRKTYGPGRYRTGLVDRGIPVALLKDNSERSPDKVVLSTMHMAKGLEYRAVFILQLQTLFHEESPLTFEDRRRFEAEELRLLHVAMTRARERLYMTYQSKVPRQIEPLETFLRSAGAAGNH